MSYCAHRSKVVLFSLCSVLVLNSACIKKKSDSDARTVVIPHSPAGDQGQIGNCWAFATLGWVESFSKSIVLQTSEKNPDLNFSEAYLTYRNIETMLTNPRAGAEHIEGQNVSDAIALVLKYGVMFEKDFHPGAHPGTPESSQVCGGLFRLKQSLQLGTFGDRSPGNIRAKLDEAFGVNMASLEKEKKVYPAEGLVLWRDENNNPHTLADYLKSLKGYSLPEDAVQLKSVLSSSNVSEESPNAFPVSSANHASTFSEETRRLVRNMRWSMNDGYPVLIDTFVDFNAYDETKGIFSFFDANGKRKTTGQT